MATQKQYFEWMKILKKRHILTDLDALILILLWYLKFYAGFWILLVLLILSAIGHVCRMNKLSKLAGMKEW